MQLNAIWVYLSSQPLLWLTVTICLFFLAKCVYFRLNSFPLLNPVLLAIVSTIALLLATNTSYQQYFEGAQFIHFLLGPATVSLAIPLIEQIGTLKRNLIPITIALFAGSLAGILSTMFLCWLVGIDGYMLLSMLPRSITTPIAMGVSEQIGGSAELTVAFVVVTGVLGAAFGIPVLGKIMRQDPISGGFALGVTAHGIGTARAFEHSPQAGAFAGLGMSLNGALTAILIPLIVWLVSLF